MRISRSTQYFIIFLAVIVIGTLTYDKWRNKEQGGGDKVITNYHQLLAGYEVSDAQLAADSEAQARLKERFEAAKQSILENPDQMGPWVEVAAIKVSAGDYRGAEDVYLYLNQIRPENSISFANLGALYMNQLKNYPKAEAMLKRNIENKPDDVPTWRNLYDLYKYHYTEKQVLLIPMLEEAIDKMPNEASFLALLAEEYAAAGQKQKAISAWREFLELQPGNAQAQQAIADLQK